MTTPGEDPSAAIARSLAQILSELISKTGLVQSLKEYPSIAKTTTWNLRSGRNRSVDVPKLSNAVVGVKDLPEWFILKKYQGAFELNSASWQEQLGIRVDCYALLFQGGNRAPPKSLFGQALAEIRKEPIVDVASSEILQAFFWQVVVKPASSSRRPVERRLVRSMTIGQLRGLHALNNPSALRGLHALGHPATSDILHVPLVKTVGGEFQAVMVNLEASDQMIEKGLAQWLKEVRTVGSAQTSIKRDTSANTKRLVRVGVLPYFDLKIWAVEAKRTISREVFAEALFPDGDNNMKRVVQAEKIVTDCR